MVVSTMARISAVSRGLLRSLSLDRSSPPVTLGILAFDTAKAMCRLVSLYKSLTDDEIANLRRHIIRSEGVAYLNSRDEAHLLNLACAERLEALDTAANTVSTLGRKCSDLGLNRFDLVYADLKLGLVDVGRLEFASRSADRIIDKMERLTSSTASLYSALETLAELETSERKLQQRKSPVSNSANQLSLHKASLELFEEKIAYQRKRVRRYKDASLWGQKMDKCVGLMARIVCVMFMRIRAVFGSSIPSDHPMNTSSSARSHKQSPHIMKHFRIHPDMSGPMEKRSLIKAGPIPINSEKRSGSEKFYSRKLKMKLVIPKDARNILPVRGTGATIRNRRTTVFHLAPESTVGGSGLALLYANLILTAEKFLNTPASIGDDARNYVYEMLPTRLRMKVRTKLRRSNIMDREEYSDTDDDDDIHGDGSSSSWSEQAEGWRDALEAIMEWLAPVAQDTVRWQSERNVEKQKFDSKPAVLLVQTLHYSDLEKTEAAIVEVLVGLSCILRYEKRYCFGGKIIN